MREMIIRMYTGDDGRSHFEELEVAEGEARIDELKAGASVSFRRPLQSDLEGFHNAPRRQYVFVLSGEREFGLADGTVRRLCPGDVMLAEDLTGQGHTSRIIGSDALSAILPLD